MPGSCPSKPAKNLRGSTRWAASCGHAYTCLLYTSLTDGSILSVGSDSELRVVQHDATSQQTSLELDYGKVRNPVSYTHLDVYKRQEPGMTQKP